ncbi:hypothetical protein CHUAL_010211 [Chamberlinius hualienensis]
MLETDDIGLCCWTESHHQPFHNPYMLPMSSSSSSSTSSNITSITAPSVDEVYLVESLLQENYIQPPITQPARSRLEAFRSVLNFGVKVDTNSNGCVSGVNSKLYLSEMASQTQTLVVDSNSLSSILDSDSSSTTSSTNSVLLQSNSESQSQTLAIPTKCTLCNDTFTAPKVLPCFHTFCQPCLEKNAAENGGNGSMDKLECPQCHQDCHLNSQGVDGLVTDYAVSRFLEISGFEGQSGVHCTACKSKESNASARCFDCANFLCTNCVMAHQFMHCFEGHRVTSFGELQAACNGKDDLKVEKPVSCLRHKTELVRYFCKTCNIPICKECTLIEHPKNLHDYEYLTEVGAKQMAYVNQLIEDGRLKVVELRGTLKNVEHTSAHLQVQYHKSQNEISETFQFYRSVLEERKQDALKELDSVYSAKQVSLSVLCQKIQEAIERTYATCEFMERALKHTSIAEVLMFKKNLDTKFQSLLNYNPEASLQSGYDIEFVSNYQAIQVGVRNTFGYIRSNSEVSGGGNKLQPIARPNGSVGSSSSSSNGCSVNGVGNNGGNVNGCPLPPAHCNGVLDRPYQNGHISSFESNILSKRFSSANNLGPFSTSLTDLNPYEKWSSGTGDMTNSLGGNTNNGVGPTNGVGCGSIFQNGNDHFNLPTDSVIDISMSGKLISCLSSSAPASFPPKSQIKRQKMIYHCKFGEFGVMEGQFTEPSGVAVNAQNDIIVADTNNHRIQIFDKEGRFKFQFGECGKRDGQLLYPNRVAVVKTSGDIIVTERSPTHQIQIYNQYGQFVRKFGANILQHPRGVTVDNKGRIVVVECKVMRVIIFDQMGSVLQKFGCSKHLEFPNGVVVNEKQEIFISDNRAHCVKVFNYEGVYLRQIGGEGITNYPIGVGINHSGEILIADNHNNFNLTIFTQDGNLVNALESKVKHAQCFDVALMDDGSVVLASKDYRLYIYRYLQVPSVGL